MCYVYLTFCSRVKKLTAHSGHGTEYRRILFLKRASMSQTNEITLQDLYEVTKAGFAGVQEQFNKVDQRLAHLEKGVGVLKEDVRVLKQDMTEVKQDVHTLKQDVTSLKQDMRIVKGAMVTRDDLNEKLATAHLVFQR